MATRQRLGVPLRGHTGWVTSLAFTGKGALASGSRDGTVKAWAVQTGRLLGTYTGSGSVPAGGAATVIAAQPLTAADGLRTVLLARAVMLQLIDRDEADLIISTGLEYQPIELLADSAGEPVDTLRRRRVVKHPVDAILTPDAKFGYPGSHGWHR